MRDEYLANQDIEVYLTRAKRKTPPVPAKVDGRVEAENEALDGHSRWTLRLLTEKAVSLNMVDSISYAQVQQI